MWIMTEDLFICRYFTHSSEIMFEALIFTIIELKIMLQHISAMLSSLILEIPHMCTLEFLTWHFKISSDFLYSMIFGFILYFSIFKLNIDGWLSVHLIKKSILSFAII